MKKGSAMSVNFYKWDETSASVKKKLLRRAEDNIAGVVEAVKPIIADVKARGDDALRDYAKKFDKADLKSIKCTDEEFAAAAKNIDANLKVAIEKCAKNVEKFHEEQMRRVEQHWMMEIEPGVWAGEQVNPIESVGLYVPRGKGAFPSALYMLAIPAFLAGVPYIAIVTPPTAQGTADDATLFTAMACGIKNVYKVGGAQAIAALAYGTQTIPKVKKVLGPGSPYVAAAKRLLSDTIDPGMPAGPSESIVLADNSAHPENTLWDILNEAEHGNDSAVLFITHDENLARFVHGSLPRAINELPEPHRSICHTVMSNYGAVVLTNSLEDSIALANEYAPEHLHLKVKNPDIVVPKLKHAGEILIGEYTPSSLGNYGIGVNHVLPTGGWAHTYSCTSVWDFLKRTSISRVDKKGFESLKDAVITLTDYENFPAHGAVLRKRVI